MSVQFTRSDVVDNSTSDDGILGGGEPAGGGFGGGGPVGGGPVGGGVPQSQPEVIIEDLDVALGAAPNFDDVAAGAWYSEAVAFVSIRGLMVGVAQSIFSPDSTLTRAMIVSILHRLADRPDTSIYENPFTDVAADAWYVDTVKWAAANDIVSGFGDGKFGPGEPVTTEQLAALIYRIQQMLNRVPAEAIEPKTFDDQDMASDWAAHNVNALLLQGLFNGIPGNLLNPQAPASRSEIASVLQRFLIAIGETQLEQ